jgi:hypothetical protein
MIVNYDHNRSFIVLTTVIMIENYDCKTFIVQATGLKSPHGSKYCQNLAMALLPVEPAVIGTTETQTLEL